MAARRAVHKLFVGNLPWTISHEVLAQYFSEFGAINSARVVFDKATGLSKGYGFVTFKKSDGIEGAVSKPNHELEGARINCQRASSSEL